MTERYKPKQTPIVIITDNKGNTIYLKDETKQFTSAFKYRGVFNKFNKLRDRNNFNTVITASTGNHGQAVALCSKFFSKKSIIVVPYNTPECKKKKIIEYGAKIILEKSLITYDECQEFAKKLAREKEYLYIHSFDDLDIIEGHKSLFEECSAYLPFDYCFCPVGGGGLVSAALTSEILNNTKVVGVEIKHNDAMKQSLSQKERVKIDLDLTNEKSFCEGILVNKIGEIPFNIASNKALEICTVTDIDVKKEIKELANMGIVAEGAGAAALAAVRLSDLTNKKILCIISGGNIDQKIYDEIIKG